MSDLRKSITVNPQEAAVVVEVAREATDPRVNVEAEEVAVTVIVPSLNVVSVLKVKNAVEVVEAIVVVVEEADHELPL
jgi:hypothetical protein